MISITRKDESITWGEIIIGAVKYSANNFISTIYAKSLKKIFPYVSIYIIECIKMKQSVVILGGNYASLLGMIRAAGLANCNITLIKTYIGKKPKTIELNSKYIKKIYFIKDADREGLIHLLLNNCLIPNEKVILLPINDDTTMTIDLYQKQLKDYFYFPTINNESGAITRFMNKSIQKQVAIQVGLNVPNGWSISVNNGQHCIPDNINYPCFTKAETSVYGGKTFLNKCNTGEELKEILNKVSQKWNCNVLVEEYIDIEKEYAVVGCSINKKVYIPGVIYLKEQGKGGHKGVAMLGEILPNKHFHDILKLLTDYIKQINYTGLFDIDFYYSNGKYYFNELNLRCGASCFAFTYKGINIPKFLIDQYNINNNIPEIYVDQPYSFFNEKVGLEAYISDFISWSEYQDYSNKGNIHSIKYKSDSKPWLAFQQIVLKSRIKKTIIFILNSLGISHNKNIKKK